MPSLTPSSLSTPTAVSPAVCLVCAGNCALGAHLAVSSRAETASKTGMVMVFGEITSSGNIDYQKVIRDAIKKIGYDDSSKGLEHINGIFFRFFFLIRPCLSLQDSTTRPATCLSPSSSRGMSAFHVEACFC